MLALSTDTVSCSKGSCRLSLSFSFILSISSINAEPSLASGIVPGSNTYVPSNSSLTDDAVIPTPEDDLPTQYLALTNESLSIVKKVDLAEPGSPMRRMWILPLLIG